MADIDRNEGTSLALRIADLTIQILILVSIVSFSIETLPNLSGATQKILAVIEIVTVAIFTIEYLVRLGLARQKWAFVTSFYGVIDLLAILPFYLGLALDLRAVRALRLLRVFRIIKLGRYSKAMDRFRRAFWDIKEELGIFFFLTSVIVYLASIGIYYFERDAQPEKYASIFHSMWWAIATLSTVGYGDVYPITVGGRIFTGVVLLTGLGLVAVPSGLLAAALTTSAEREQAGERSKVEGADVIAKGNF